MKDALLRMSCLSLSMALCLSGCARVVNTVVLDKPVVTVVQEEAETKEAVPALPKVLREEHPQPMDDLSLPNCTVELWDFAGRKPPFITFKTKNDEEYKQEFRTGDRICFVHATRELLPIDRGVLLKLDSRHRKYIAVQRISENGQYDYFLYDVTGNPVPLARLSTGAYPVAVERLDGLDKFVISFEDGPLPDWGARTVCPEFKVVWRWDGQKFRIEKRDMLKNEDSSIMCAVIADEFKRGGYPGTDGIVSAPPELAEEVINRYISEGRKSARRFYDSCWPKHLRGKKQYWAFLMKEAKSSKCFAMAESLRAKNSHKHNPNIPEITKL